jgi:integrase/recombinase XerD
MKQAKTLTAAELRRVTDSIATRAHPVRNRAMLMMTHLAGLRVGEVAQLAWADVVTAEGTVREEVRLNADQTKGILLNNFSPAGSRHSTTATKSL